jgi:CheY-like chemotaxis protein
VTPGGDRIRVFLVDDVRELRALIRLVLEDDPAIEVVGEAGDGRDGVEGVARAQPDVVLLDLSMPGMDGLEAIPLIRERAPGARIVVLSGHESGRVSLEALEQGASRYVNKASELETIRAAVREVVRVERPFADERFGVVRSMWTKFLNGDIDELVGEADPDAVFGPCRGSGPVSGLEVRELLERLRASGRLAGVRAHGVELHGDGLIVAATVTGPGAGTASETEVHFVFCFRGVKVALAAAFDHRDAAERAIRENCAA